MLALLLFAQAQPVEAPVQTSSAQILTIEKPANCTDDFCNAEWEANEQIQRQLQPGLYEVTHKDVYDKLKSAGALCTPANNLSGAYCRVTVTKVIVVNGNFFIQLQFASN